MQVVMKYKNRVQIIESSFAHNNLSASVCLLNKVVCYVVLFSFVIVCIELAAMIALLK